MGRKEELMKRHPKFTFYLRTDMPDCEGGLIYDNDVYINQHHSVEEQTGYVAEELGHAYTTIGDISELKNRADKRQERQARRWGMNQLVSPKDLVKFAEDSQTTVYEVAEDLEITPEYLLDGLQNIREQYGEQFRYKEYWFDLRNGVRVSKIA